jgi:phosphoribosylformylglycinamidine cyclo-ligase
MLPGGLHAIAHITGGGIADNLVRVLPEYCRAVIDRKSWTPNPVFPWLQKLGGIADAEMFSVFNMGIGMIFAVPAECAHAVLTAVSTPEFPAVILGTIQKQQQQEATVELVD